MPYAGAGYEYHHECRFVDQNGNIINPREKHTCSDPLAANEKPYYIKAKGCFLSDSANLLTYHGVTVDPPTLNTALNGLRGGYINYNVSPDGLHTYSVQNGGNMSFVRRDRNLAQDICTYGPQIMGVHCTTDSRTGRQNPGHWVTVYGQPTDKSTWLIHDPNGGVSSTLAARYPAGYCASIVLVLEIVCLSLIACAQQQGAATGSRPGSAVTKQKPATVTLSREPASMTIACQSAVDLMITDPQGRRLGDNPIAHAHYDEIPNAYYETGGIDDDETGASEEDPAKTIFIPNPASGSYKLAIVGAKTGKYSCQFSGQDAEGTRESTELKDVPIRTDEVQVFMVRFPAAANSKIEVKSK